MNNNRWNDRSNRRNQGYNDRDSWSQRSGSSSDRNWSNNDNRNRGYGQGSYGGSDYADNDYNSRSNLTGGQYGRSNDRYGSRGDYDSGYNSYAGYGGYQGHDNRGNMYSNTRGGGYAGSGNYDRGYEGNNYRSNDDYSRSYDDRQRDWHRDGDRNFFDKAGDEISSWFGDEEARRRREQDQRENDQYGNRYGGSSWLSENRGKGPKNYQRSDDRIKEDVNDKLSDDWGIDASDIDVEVNNGEVTLSGTVNSRNAKRRAEDIVEMISGVRNVENRIRVSDSAHQQTSSQSYTAAAGATGVAGNVNSGTRKSIV